MPRKLKEGLQRRDLDPAVADVLLRTGWDFFGKLAAAGIVGRDGSGQRIILDEGWLRAAWQERRAIVMEADHAQHGVFHRPWAWWRYEAKTDEPDKYAGDGYTYDRAAHRDWLRAHPQFLTLDEEKLLTTKGDESQ